MLFVENQASVPPVTGNEKLDSMMQKLVNRIRNESQQQEVRVSRFETVLKQIPNQAKKSLDQDDMQDIYDFDLQKD